MIRHTGPISGIAAFRDEWVATAGYDNQLILWRASDKRAVQRTSHDHLANQCEFSPCGRYLVSSSSDYSARLWSVPDLRLQAVLGDHRDDVEMSTFSASGELIATAGRDASVRVFDLQGRLVQRFEGHSDDVNSVAWSDDGKHIASVADDGYVFVWRLGSELPVSSHSVGDNQADTVALSGDTLFAGDDDGGVTIIRDNETHTQKAHDAGIKRLAYYKGARLLVSLSYDRRMKVWRHENGGLTELSSCPFPSLVWARACAFLGADRIVTGTFGSSYATFHIPTSTWDLSGVEQTGGVNAVHYFGRDQYTVGDAGVVHVDTAPSRELGSLCNFLESCGPRVLTGGQTGEVFDATTGEVLHQHRSPLNCGAAFERDGKPWLAIGSYTGEVLFFEFDGHQARHRHTLNVHTNAIKGLAWRKGTLFSVCADTSARYTNTLTLQPGHLFPAAHSQIANGCTAYAHGFASISRDRKLRLWDEHGHISQHETPHTHSIKCIAASRDGLSIATGSYNGLLAVFDVRQARFVLVERLTAAGLSSLCASPDGHFVASSYDGKTYSRAVDSGTPERERFPLAS